MKFQIFSTSLVVAAALSASQALAKSVQVDVTLKPAGSFKMKTQDIKGDAVQSGDTVKAENIVVRLEGLDSSIELRDKHAKDKYLETKKYPEAVLVKAIGKGGKGEGLLRIRGIEKKVSGTYKIEGNELNAEFPIKLSDYKIDKIKYMGIGVSDEAVIHVSVPVKQK